MDVKNHPFLHSSILSLLSCLLLGITLFAELSVAQPAAPDSTYRIYTGRGETTTLDAVVAATDSVDVVFVGEVHHDPTAHALHWELFQQVHQRYVQSDSDTERSVVLSLEMFERDVQPVLDEYLAGLITEKHFLASSRPWNHYRTAYRPLVEYAKTHDLDVLAANAPRRYVNRVSRRGLSSLDSLPHTAKQWLPPLPPPAPSGAYRAKWNARMRSAAAATDSSRVSPHGAPTDTTTEADSSHTHPGASMEHMLQAQALWDATMAHTIATRLMHAPEALVLHVTGGFHVSEGTGTPEQLLHYRPSARLLVVVLRPVDDITAFDPDEHGSLGDFVVLTDAERLPEHAPTGPGN